MTLRHLAVSLQPFVDPGGDCYIMVEVEGQAEAEVIPLDSRQAKSVICNRLCDILGQRIPREQEVRTTLAVLYGFALEQKRQVVKPSLAVLVARKPLAQVVILIARKGGTQKTPTQLLAAVNNVARTNGIDTRVGPWPANEDSLGKQLSSLADVVRRKGVVLEPGRSDTRFWTIHPYSPASDESVREASGETLVPADTTGVPDASLIYSPAHTNCLNLQPPNALPDPELQNLLNGALK